MRLVCPNCEAKYEVPADAIPETGRDVQCANCGHAWYQMRPRAAVAEAVAAAPLVAAPLVAAPVAKAPEPEPPAPEPAPEPEPVAAPEVAFAPESAPIEPEPEVTPEAAVPDPVAASAEVAVEPVADPVAEVGIEPDPVVEPVAVMAEPEPLDAPVVADPVPEAVTAPDGDEESLAGAPAALAAAAAPAAYAVDESVLAILREEAEREAQARKSDVGKPLEVQADLGIESAPLVKKKPVEVISTDADVPALAEEADDKLAGRKTRLPDVEEINSTLRPSEQGMDGTGDASLDVAAEGRSSFRSGFLLVMTFAIIGAALYISADALAQAVPPLADLLKGYVGMVDSLRLQLDGLMQSATVAINGSGT